MGFRSGSWRAGRYAVPLAFSLILSACAASSESADSGAPEQTDIQGPETAEPGDLPVEPPGSPSVPPPGAEEESVPSLVDESPPFIATPTPAPGRSAPDASAGSLDFSGIRVFPVGGGLAGSANMTNTGDQFLNALTIGWEVLVKAGGGRSLASGTVEWPSLGPGETATIRFEGDARYEDVPVRVLFSFPA
ncbi:MAG: hypothetical protein ACRDH9_01205 [Actinomycetota bacterium]